MNSTERREARYKRRRARREYRRTHAKSWPDNYERKRRRTGGRYNTAPRAPVKLERWRAFVPYCDDLDWIFSHTHHWNGHFKCRKGKRWKPTVQRYDLRAPINIHRDNRTVLLGTYRPGPLTCFTTYERGKARDIRAEKYRDRVVACCLYMYGIVPGICRHFIHDNGANMERKGQSFTINRAVADLRHYYAEHGTNGYVLLFDFKKFFDNVPHDVVLSSVDKAFKDKRILALTEKMLTRYGEKGLGLGSPVNQALALESANMIDHHIQERLTAEAREVFGPDIPPVGKYYARYMDDGRLYYPRKDVLKWVLNRLRELCAAVGITINEVKTQIHRVKNFTWLHVKFRLTETGRVIKRIARRSVTRMRQKLKKLRKKVDAGIIPESAVYAGFRSWCGHAQHFNSICTIIKMFKLYLELYSYRPRKEIVLKCGKYKISEPAMPLMLHLMETQPGFGRARAA